MLSTIKSIFNIDSSLSPLEAVSPIDVPPNNGSILCEVYIPDEIMILILSFVNKQTLVQKCNLVCKKWHKLIKEIWKVKAERQNPEMFYEIRLQKRLPYQIYQVIAWKNPFGRNLLKNNTGQNGFQDWKILANGGDRWKVESPPVGVPETVILHDHIHCFTTSFGPCVKQQCVDLYDEGMTPDLMDAYQPNIYIEEWYTARCDCASYYELKVELLDKKKKNLGRFEFREDMRSWVDGWKKVSYTFEYYGPGVRYVLFTHTGCDLQFWAGNYGSKMAGAMVEFPSAELNKMQIKNDSYFIDEF